MISFQCPKCKATLKTTEDKARLRSKCRKCGCPVQIPMQAVIEEVIEVTPADSSERAKEKRSFPLWAIGAIASGVLLFCCIGGVLIAYLAVEIWQRADVGIQPCPPRREFLSWYEYWLDGGNDWWSDLQNGVLAGNLPDFVKWFMASRASGQGENTIMRLFYDKSDLLHAKKLRDERFAWIQTLGAADLSVTPSDEKGFFFGYQHGDKHYRHLLGNRPFVLDPPEHWKELARLDDVLRRLQEKQIEVPAPKTWVIGVDDDLPADLTFPLFVRTPKSSWKRGGTQARVKNMKELADEMGLLRRAFGWNSPILARQWIDVAVAGKFMFGDAPKEVRVWIVNHKPIAWSFHYLHAVPKPRGFPPTDKELSLLAEMATKIGSAFGAYLIVADFVRDRRGGWHFLEAGAGSAAGTAHEAVFKFVAQTMLGTRPRFLGDSVGGPL